MSRRRGRTDTLVTIFWRDIPAQVTARTGGERDDGRRPTEEKALLDARFQHAIDRAAAVAGKTDATSYVAEWQRVIEPLTGPPGDAVRARVAELEASFDRDTLERLVRSGGVQEESP